MSFIKEIWSYLNIRKKYWLFPVILLMLMLGVLIVFAQGTVIAPFVYTFF